MKTQPRQHISNKYNTCTVVTSPVYIGSKFKYRTKRILKMANFVLLFLLIRAVETIIAVSQSSILLEVL